MKKLVAAVVSACLVVAPAWAERRVDVALVPAEGTGVRFSQGVATFDQRREHGAVQLTPLGLDHGRLTFGVVVLNLGPGSDDFGVEDIHAAAAGQDLPVLTRERLDQMARNRAGWAQFAVALAAGLGAAAAASSHDTYRATTYTPHGTYRTIFRTPSTAGQVAAAGMVAGGAYSIASIQNQLDATRAALADEIVQTTTIDPDDSYGGRFVVEKIRGPHSGWPQDVRIVVHFNGEDYPFAVRVTQAH